MRVEYKGFEINVTKEKCLGGWEMLYFNVYRISDGLCVEDSFTEGEETVRGMVGYMKDRVDEFIETKGVSEYLKDEF